MRYNRGKSPLLIIFNKLSPNHRSNPFFFFFKQEIISEEIVDETDQFEDNRTKVVASRCANSTMMKGYVFLFFTFFYFIFTAFI